MSNRFAQNDEEANLRYNKYKSEDPFPDIFPALLNSADIEDYVAVTGMIYPFDPKQLKPATYPLNLLGKYVYWDEKGEKHRDNIVKGQDFKLKNNSIVFLTLEPTFRIPDYIALRFNFKIQNVYRGLLLGTGPIVDPGFVGRLSMPLHNFTTNDYILRGGESLIWIEFTKLSSNDLWIKKNEVKAARSGKYREFKRKEVMDVEDYLRKADPHRPIRSSIPDAIYNAKNAAEKAEKTTKRFERATIIAAIALGLTLIFGFYQVFSLVQDSINYVSTTEKDFKNIQNNELKRIESLEKELQSLKKNLTKHSKQMINTTEKPESQSKDSVPQDAKSDK